MFLENQDLCYINFSLVIYMDFLTEDNSIYTLESNIIETKSKSDSKSLFQLLTNQKAFVESSLEDYDMIKINMKKLNVIYTDDMNNLGGSIIKEKNIVII